ncbi:Alcohol dehydrogenase [hydrothermal vent metagenome]|uniref:Alcohol dehydrogenase n=1 Tax=hydrothermal vent metagenome TaxID=652676 RepID=A0A3B0YSX0_9ZZZZ
MTSENKEIAGNWNYPTQVRFGAGRINELVEVCQFSGLENPLLVTDSGLADLPMLKQVLKQCENAGLQLAVFKDVKSNPTGENVREGLAVYKMGKHDGVIAFGGGSSLDAGKAIAVIAGQNHDLWDFEDEDDNWLRVNANIVPPIIAVPTTAGTGSEVGRASVIHDVDAEKKKIIFHPKMLPHVVIADPELTLGLNAKITAATGMDALSHNLEAYCAPGYHPMADGIAVEGIRLIKDNLITAVQSGNNIAARSHMLAASMMGATAFQKGLGAMHALAHPLGALYDTHHGLLNAVLMPYVLLHNRPAIESRICRLAKYIELEDVSFDGFMQWVLELRKVIGIPHCLSDIGINTARRDEISRMALADPSNSGNPRNMTIEAYQSILEHAYKV